MRLDTIEALPDKDELVLLWRGLAPTADILGQDLLWLQVEVNAVNDPREALDTFAERLLAAYHASLADEDARMLAPVAEDPQEVCECLAKANIPNKLQQQVAATDASQVLYDVLSAYVQRTLRELQERVAALRG